MQCKLNNQNKIFKLINILLKKLQRRALLQVFNEYKKLAGNGYIGFNNAT